MDASTEELWRPLLSEVDESLERRCAALAELVERKDPHLAPMVIVDLSNDNLSPRWRDALIRATPRIQVTDESLRSSLASSLWKHASTLKAPQNDEEEQVLWTAIRRYATLRPESNIGQLLEFLADPDEPLPRRHVVLLAITNAFYGWAPMEGEAESLEKLRSRVSELARRYMDRSRLETPHERAVALASYCAAAALGCSDLDELTDQALALDQSWLTELAAQKLSPMLERWRARDDGSGSGAVPDRLQKAIEKLTTSLSRQAQRE